MIRLIAMILMAAIACVPAWFAWQEFGVIYNGLWEMRADYTFEKEMFVRGHIFNSLLWSIVVVAIIGIACHVGSTPEERRWAKEFRRQELGRQARECVRLKPASIRLERRNR